MKKIPAKQQAFAREYAVDWCGKAAAKRAGYAGEGNALEVRACELLKKPGVIAEIEKHKNRLLEKQRWSKEELIKECENLLNISKNDGNLEMILKTLQYIGKIIGVDHEIKMQQINIDNRNQNMSKEDVLEMARLMLEEQDIIDVDPRQ